MGAADDSSIPFFMGGDYIQSSQCLYKTSVLDLNSLCHLMEATNDDHDSSKCLYLLPGCHGRATLPTVQTNQTELRKRLFTKVPWLKLLWQKLRDTGVTCFVTGSLLSAALLPSTAASVPPGDVDLFVESRDQIDRCFDILSICVRSISPSTELTSERVSTNKIRIKLTNTLLEHVDLYSHPLTRISQYHMSLVRAAFDGEILYCTPSAASALSTGVNASFSIKWKPERAKNIIWRKWSSGASMLVNKVELRLFLKYARHAILPPRAVSNRLRKAIRICRTDTFKKLQFSRRFEFATEPHARARLKWRVKL